MPSSVTIATIFSLNGTTDIKVEADGATTQPAADNILLIEVEAPRFQCHRQRFRSQSRHRSSVEQGAGMKRTINSTGRRKLTLDQVTIRMDGLAARRGRAALFG